MKQLSKNLALLVLFLLVGQQVFSYDFEVNGIYYIFNPENQTAIVCSGEKEYEGTVTVPSVVTYNGRSLDVEGITSKAFYNNKKLDSISISDGITWIGDEAFYGCTELSSVSLPKTLKTIGYYYYASQGVFYNCRKLKTITIPDGVKCLERRTFRSCVSLESIRLGSGVEIINDYAFDGCAKLKTVIIPGNVKTIGEAAFSNCTGIDTLVFKDCETPLVIQYKKRNESEIIEKIYGPAYWYFGRECQMQNVGNYWEKLETLTIGKNIKSQIFPSCYKLEKIYSMIENPMLAACDFSSTAYVNATLFVPVGTKEKYMAADGWKNFFNIQEMAVEDMWNGQGEPNVSDNPQQQKCEKPTIHYSKGKLSFDCATDGAICQSTITDTDIASYSGNEIQLSATYNISVYASKEGFDNSDVATATLCWIDVDPKTEGIESGVAQVSANAVLIQNHDGTIYVESVSDGTDITVYNTSGQKVGSGKAHGNCSSIATNLRSGSVAIVRIGDKSVKIVMT